MSLSQAAYSVHQCVYRCAMHWRRVTANRVRQRGGKPRPRRETEPKSDWPVAMLPGATRSVPSIDPSTYTMEVHRLERNTLRIFHNLLEKEVYYCVVPKVILSCLLREKLQSLRFSNGLFSFSFFARIASEGFKERPRPRKPDYLRESFDFSKISIATNISPRAPSTRVTEQEDDDETKPRSSPPRPSYQMRSNIHPYQRNLREESIVFPSSSGEESFPAAEGAKQTLETVGEILNVLLIILRC